MPHATGRCDGRQEGDECGYYDLHSNLNETLLHSSPPFLLVHVACIVIPLLLIIALSVWLWSRRKRSKKSKQII